MGCIQYRLGKYHLAGHCFSKSAQSAGRTLALSAAVNPRVDLAEAHASEASKSTPESVSQSASNSRNLIRFLTDTTLVSYNCGMQLLSSAKPEPAIVHLHQGFSVTAQNPLMWLRVGEACVAKYAQKAAVELQFDCVPRLPSVMCPTPRCIVLPPNPLAAFDKLGDVALSALPPGNSLIADGSGQTRVPSSLDYGSKCLRNALILSARFSSAAGSSIQQAALSNLAYASLCVNNPVGALRFSQSLLQLPDISAVARCLGTMYLAEALLQLNQPDEAFSRLNLQLQSGFAVDIDLSPVHDRTGSSFLRSSALQCSLFTNLAAVQIHLGNTEDARTIVERVLSADASFVPALRMSAYLHLRSGDHATALSMLVRQRALPKPFICT